MLAHRLLGSSEGLYDLLLVMATQKHDSIKSSSCSVYGSNQCFEIGTRRFAAVTIGVYDLPVCRSLSRACYRNAQYF